MVHHKTVLNLPGKYCIECDIMGLTSAHSDSSLPTQVDIPMRTGFCANTSSNTIRDHLVLVYDHPTTSQNCGVQCCAVYRIAWLILSFWLLHENRHVRTLMHAYTNPLQSPLFLLLYCPQLPPLPRPVHRPTFLLQSIHHTLLFRAGDRRNRVWLACVAAVAASQNLLPVNKFSGEY